MIERLALQEVQDEIRNLRTLIITFIAGSFVVPIGTLGTDSMIYLLALRKPWLCDYPQGMVLVAIWICAIVPLALAMLRLSPGGNKSPSRLCDRLMRDYSQVGEKLTENAKQLFENRINKALAEVRPEMAKVYRLVISGFIFLTFTIVIEIGLALQYF